MLAIKVTSKFTNFESFILVSYKSNLIFTLLLRAFQLCSNFKLFHQEILTLKNNFLKNGYPFNFINVCIKRFLNNIFIDKKVHALAPKKGISMRATIYWEKIIKIKI